MEIYTPLDPDIILLAHTNIHPPKILKFHPYIVYTHNIDRYASGVAILIKPEIKHSKINRPFIGDTLAIKVDTTLGPIIIGTHYSPPRHLFIPIPDINFFSRNETPAYLIGDLNAHHTSFDTRDNAYGRVLYHEWLMMGYLRRIGPPTGTYKTNKGKITKPDIALVNRNCYHFHHCTSLPFNVSDHAPICLEISARAIKIPAPEFELNAKANWNLYQNHIKANLPPINLNLQNTPTNQTYIQTFSEIIQNAKRLAIPRSTFKYSNKRNTSHKFRRFEKILAHIHTLIDLNQNNPIIIRNLNNNKRRIINNLIEEANRLSAKSWEELLNKLNQERKLDPKKFWSQIQPILGRTQTKRIKVTDTGEEEGNILTDPTQIEAKMREEWRNHFIKPPIDKIHPDSLTQNQNFHQAHPNITTPTISSTSADLTQIAHSSNPSNLWKPIKPSELLKTEHPAQTKFEKSK